jgi:hypothetical protein
MSLTGGVGKIYAGRAQEPRVAASATIDPQPQVGCREVAKPLGQIVHHAGYSACILICACNAVRRWMVKDDGRDG